MHSLCCVSPYIQSSNTTLNVKLGFISKLDFSVILCEMLPCLSSSQAAGLVCPPGKWLRDGTCPLRSRLDSLLLKGLFLIGVFHSLFNKCRVCGEVAFPPLSEQARGIDLLMVWSLLFCLMVLWIKAIQFPESFRVSCTAPVRNLQASHDLNPRKSLFSLNNILAFDTVTDFWCHVKMLLAIVSFVLLEIWDAAINIRGGRVIDLNKPLTSRSNPTVCHLNAASMEGYSSRRSWPFVQSS